MEKFQGMAEAMRSRGLELNDDYIKWCISDEAHNESYVRAIERFLKSIPKCTAIVCCNYIIYRLVIKTLQKMGKSVPEDYSLVCFDYSEANLSAGGCHLLGGAGLRDGASACAAPYGDDLHPANATTGTIPMS